MENKISKISLKVKIFSDIQIDKSVYTNINNNKHTTNIIKEKITKKVTYFIYCNKCLNYNIYCIKSNGLIK